MTMGIMAQTNSNKFLSRGRAGRNSHYMCALLLLVCTGLILSAFANQKAYAQDITSDLVGYWKLDEISGSSVNSSIDNINGTWSDSDDNEIGAEAITGIINGGLQFDGTDDIINLGDNLDLSALTICAWVKPQSPTEGYVIGKFSTGTNSGYYFRAITDTWQIGFRGSDDDKLNASIEYDEWQHLCAIIAPGPQTSSIYKNGELVESKTSLLSISDNSVPLTIGNRIDGLRPFRGSIDEVRIYNRLLDANDVRAIYELNSNTLCQGASDAGKMIFNPDYAVMQYCDGAAWIDMGKEASVLHGQKVTGGGYDINGVVFNGTTHLAQGSLTGTDPRYVTGSFWVKRNTANLGTSQGILAYRNADNEYFRIRFNTSNELVLDGQETGVGVYQLLARSAAAITDGNWHHVAFSIDSTNRALDQIYLDDSASVTSNPYTFSAFGGGEEAVVGSFTTAGSERLYGALADLWIDFDNYIDFSDEANRRKFINADGRAVNLGADGSLPIGTAPDVFLSGDTANWHTNKGLMAGFSETGTLTTETIPPPRDYEKKLVGWWKMSETGGGTVRDSSETGLNGTMNGGMSGDDSVTGPVGKALEFDGTNDTVSFPNNSAINLNTMTISMWIKPDEVITPTNGIILMENRAGGSSTNYEFVIDGEGSGTSNEGVLQLSYYNGGWRSIFSTIEPVIGEWQHLAMTIDSVTNTYAFYLNGVQTDTGTSTYDLVNSFPSLTMSLGNGDDPGSSEYYDGQMDDVRIYNYALSEEEMEELYNMGSRYEMGNAVDFGSRKVIRNAPLLDVEDDDKFTGSFWFRTTATNNSRIIDTVDQNFHMQIVPPTGYLALRVSNPGSGLGTHINANYGSALNNGIWHHIMMAADAGAGTLQVYIDGVLVPGSVYGFDSTVMDFTSAIWSIGGNPTTPYNTINDDMAEVWFDFGTFVDLSVEANRLKFRQLDGYAADLGAKGQRVTGSAPDLYFTGDATNWFINQGTGGEFTATGTLTDSPTSPYLLKSPPICADSGFPSGTLIYNSDEEVMSYCDGHRDIALGPPGDGGAGCANPSGEAGSLIYNDSFATLQYCDGRNWRGVGSDPLSDLLAADLVGHWRFDETSGGVAYDSSGNGLDLGLAGGMTAGDANTTGVMGGAFEFNGTTNYLREVTNDPLLRVAQNTSITLSTWVKMNANATFNNIFRYDDLDQADGDGLTPRTYLIYGIQGDGGVYFRFGPSGGTNSLLTSPAGTISDDRWHHVTGVRDVANDRHVIYVDGEIVAEQADASAGTWETTGQYLMVGRYENSAPGEYFSGTLDDLRFYRRALNDAEVAALFTTTSPECETGPIGTQCADGAVYAGTTVGGARMYVANADESGSYAYGGYTTDLNGDNASAVPELLDDGLANTNWLLTSGAGNHNAAQACRNKGADWYLPAIEELGKIYANRAQLGHANLPTSTQWYWSSSEYSGNRARLQRFNNGGQPTNDKYLTDPIRCVRR